MPRTEKYHLAFVTVALFGVVVLFRPLLPIDETRYLTVAWELYLRQDWLAPLTLNFELYEHKPPLLFWVINLFWGVFGVSRWAATIPVFMAFAAVILLTGRLYEKLGFGKPGGIVYVMTGSLPLLLYGSAIMFDVTLTVLVLAAVLCLQAWGESGRGQTLALLGLCIGLAVLTKGPVAYLYLFFPMLFGPYWHAAKPAPGRWYRGMLAALALSLLPVLAWLYPVLHATNDGFAHALLWEQTVSRITGSQSMAHARPVWFYVPVLFLFALPWLFWPPLWRSLGKMRKAAELALPGHRLLLVWLPPCLLSFSLISGKQPHYLIPLLPGFAILLTWLLQDIPLGRLRTFSTVFVLVVLGSQVWLGLTYASRYDLRPVADMLSSSEAIDWAFVENYHGELGFLARLDEPIDVIARDEWIDWFRQHRCGAVVASYTAGPGTPPYPQLLSMAYRGGRLGVFVSDRHHADIDCEPAPAASVVAVSTQEEPQARAGAS